MFKFFKEKLKGALEKFTKKAEEEVKEEVVEETEVEEKPKKAIVTKNPKWPIFANACKPSPQCLQNLATGSINALQPGHFLFNLLPKDSISCPQCLQKLDKASICFSQLGHLLAINC